MVRVAIASPFDIWSAGVEAILQSAGCSVVGRWLAVDHMLGTAKLAKADLLILSRRLIGDCAQPAAVRLVAGFYKGGIVIVLEPSDMFSTEEFLALDVEGLILSSASTDDLSDCVASVACGRRWIDPGIRALLGHAQRPVANFRGLSSREFEVARLAASGLSNKQIARELQVSDGTVKMHMHHVLAKLRLSSRIDLVRSFAGSDSDALVLGSGTAEALANGTR